MRPRSRGKPRRSLHEGAAVRNIRRVGERLAAGWRGSRRRGAAVLAVDVDETDGRAAARELLRGRAPESAPRAGDRTARSLKSCWMAMTSLRLLELRASTRRRRARSSRSSDRRSDVPMISTFLSA